MVTRKDLGTQKLANGKALTNASLDSLKHSLLGKNNQLRKVVPQPQKRQRGICACLCLKKQQSGHLRSVIA